MDSKCHCTEDLLTIKGDTEGSGGHLTNWQVPE